MQKDFWKWHKAKEQINNTKGTALFHEREVWWCRVGVNVGFEMDGRGETFERPVVIVGKIADRDATAVLSQIRFIDRKRLANKITMLDSKIFRELIKEITRVNLATP